MGRPSGVYFTKRTTVRVNIETVKRAKWLMKHFPEDYTNFSYVVRSGVNALFNKKECDLNGCRAIVRKTKRVS